MKNSKRKTKRRKRKEKLEWAPVNLTFISENISNGEIKYKN